jgi:hypothetical protein
MFRANHEDERPPSGMEDGRDKEARKDKRQAKKEAEEKEDKKIRHIKVRRHHLGMDKEPTEEVDEEEEKFKPRGSTDNPSNQTMPSGAGGFMTSLAMGAKGPGAAGGQMIQMSEPMRMAHQLLKEQIGERAIDGVPHVTWMSPKKITGWIDGRLMLFGLPQWAANNEHTASISGEEKPFTPQEQFMSQVFDESGNLKSEPMDIAWQLLKMSEAEALQYHHPDEEAQRYIDRKRSSSGAQAGHMRRGLSHRIRQDAIGRGERNVALGIPPYLRYAHGSHPEMLRHRAMMDDDKAPMLPTRDDEKNKIADSADVARQIKLNPSTLYHRRAYSNTMLPTGPFTEPEPEPEPDIQDSPIPGMAFVNGQLVPDPRIEKGSAMDIAWQLLKSDSKRSIARRRKKEGYAKWRPSTGQFERPKGGGDPRNATSRRAKNISRNLPLGRKTGLMKPHLSVEFSHRGLASKQPMSKDPQKYRAYLASQEARKLQGGVRSTVTPHMRHSQRSFISGQTGGGRLTNTLQYPRVPRPRLHAVRAPSIQPPKMKMPRLTRPKMPSMVTMSEDTPQHSDILKAGNAYQAALMRIALKEIRELMREKKDKDKKAKGKGNPDTAGAASNLPNYEANNPKTATRPEGGTEDENDSRLWGLSPGDLAGRGSGRV